jgi:opacity protein-like surface antigen
LAGIGAYITDLDVHVNNGTAHSSTEVTYGFHAGAGFNINFPNNMFIGLEGKYLWAEPSFGGDHVKLDGFITTANLGFRF